MFSLFKKKSVAQKALEKIADKKNFEQMVTALQANGWHEPYDEYKKTSLVGIFRSPTTALVIHNRGKLHYRLEQFYFESTPEIEWLAIEADDYTHRMHVDLKVFCRQITKE